MGETAFMCASFLCRQTMKLIAPQAPHTALFSDLLKPEMEKYNS